MREISYQVWAPGCGRESARESAFLVARSARLSVAIMFRARFSDEEVQQKPPAGE
jgi:hypothetical protein